jgi:hypothetical protein
VRPARSGNGRRIHRPDPAAHVESALVLGCLSDSVLERRGHLRVLRHRLPRSGSSRLRRLPEAADGRRHPHPDGPHAVGALRRGGTQGATCDSMALGQRPAVHRDSEGALRARVGSRADHHPAYSPQSNGLLDVLAGILADALLADLETEMEEEHRVAVATAGSPRGTGSQAERLVATSPRTPDAA